MKQPLAFIVSQSYAISDEESREAGENIESGLDFTDEQMSLEELEQHFDENGFTHTSSVPVGSRHDYITSTPSENRDFFEKGHHKTHTLHLTKIIDADGNDIDEKKMDDLWKVVLHRQVERAMGKDVDFEISL